MFYHNSSFNFQLIIAVVKQREKKSTDFTVQISLINYSF